MGRKSIAVFENDREPSSTMRRFGRYDMPKKKPRAVKIGQVKQRGGAEPDASARPAENHIVITATVSPEEAACFVKGHLGMSKEHEPVKHAEKPSQWVYGRGAEDWGE